MKYLITGGAGFIGSHTAAELIRQGAWVRVLDDLSTGRADNLSGLSVELIQGSITDPQVVRAALAGCSRVIHLAACPGVPASCADPIGFDRVNVHGTVVVFEEARRAGVERVVYASSCAIYGSAGGDTPRKEEDPPQVESPYAASKAANELYARTFSYTLGLPCVGLRYFNVFGPRQDPRGPYAAVIPRFVEAALRGNPLTVFGDSEHSRDFISVVDVAKANILASTTPAASGQVYNIGSGRATTVRQIAQHVLNAIPTSSAVQHYPERPGDIRQMLSDPSRAARDLGWQARADFSTALSKTIRWYSTLAGL